MGEGGKEGGGGGRVPYSNTGGRGEGREGLVGRNWGEGRAGLVRKAGGREGASCWVG